MLNYMAANFKLVLKLEGDTIVIANLAARNHKKIYRNSTETVSLKNGHRCTSSC